MAIHYKLNGPPRRLYNIHSLGVIEHNTCEVCTDFDRLWCTARRVENIHDHFMIYPVNIWSTGGMFHQCCILTKIFWVKKLGEYMHDLVIILCFTLSISIQLLKIYKQIYLQNLRNLRVSSIFEQLIFNFNGYSQQFF